MPTDRPPSLPSWESSEQVEASPDWDQDEAYFYGRMALEYGLRLSAMEADWAHWVIDQIDARGRREMSRKK